MARRKPNQPTGEIKLELGELYPKQWQFIESKTRYTAYGGARGGGTVAGLPEDGDARLPIEFCGDRKSTRLNSSHLV